MPDYTVVRYGTDSSGRAIWMTRYMIDVFEAILRHPDVEPFARSVTIVQGAFMTRNGGGAAASAGYHDQGGSLDIRTWNLTTTQLDAFIRVSRLFGFPFWRRDLSALHGGMDSHAHGTLGSDYPLTSGARASWSSYVNGGNGLANNATDYEWRPSPLVLKPPADLMKEDYLMTDAGQKKLDEIIRKVDNLDKGLDSFRSAEHRRYREDIERSKKSKSELVALIGGVVDALGEISNKVDDDATKVQVRRLKTQLTDALAQDDNIDGADAPA